MTGMLRIPEGRGYPADYLRARLRGRARHLIADWERLLDAPDPASLLPPAPWRHRSAAWTDEGAWRGALREFTWVHAQMEPRLRECFTPLFCWFELRTVILVLRLREGGDHSRAAALLDESLLAPAVRRRLGGGEPAEAVAGLGAILSAENGKFGRLAETFRREGRPGVEEDLVTLWLEGVATKRLHPPLGEFFRRLIDLRNVVALAKGLRWRPASPPPFVGGGSLSPALLGEIAARGEPEALLRLLERLGGGGVEEWAAANPEPPLLGALTKEIRRWGKEGSGIGPILDHLWRCCLEARNLGIIIRGRDLDREAIRRELVP